jgi:hypothetical protein
VARLAEVDEEACLSAAAEVGPTRLAAWLRRLDRVDLTERLPPEPAGPQHLPGTIHLEMTLQSAWSCSYRTYSVPVPGGILDVVERAAGDDPFLPQMEPRRGPLEDERLDELLRSDQVDQLESDLSTRFGFNREPQSRLWNLAYLAFFQTVHDPDLAHEAAELAGMSIWGRLVMDNLEQPELALRWALEAPPPRRPRLLAFLLQSLTGKPGLVYYPRLTEEHERRLDLSDEFLAACRLALRLEDLTPVDLDDFLALPPERSWEVLEALGNGLARRDFEWGTKVRGEAERRRAQVFSAEIARARDPLERCLLEAARGNISAVLPCLSRLENKGYEVRARLGKALVEQGRLQDLLELGEFEDEVAYLYEARRDWSRARENRSPWKLLALAQRQHLVGDESAAVTTIQELLSSEHAELIDPGQCAWLPNDILDPILERCQRKLNGDSGWYRFVDLLLVPELRGRVNWLYERALSRPHEAYAMAAGLVAFEDQGRELFDVFREAAIGPGTRSPGPDAPPGAG